MIKSGINIHSSHHPSSAMTAKHITYILTSCHVPLYSLQVTPLIGQSVIHSLDFALIPCNLKRIRFGDFHEAVPVRSYFQSHPNHLLLSLISAISLPRVGGAARPRLCRAAEGP